MAALKQTNRLTDEHYNMRNACKGVLTKKQNDMKTIDCTPTWESLVPLFIAIIKNADNKGIKEATIELKRMAQAADQYNIMVDEQKRLTDEA